MIQPSSSPQPARWLKDLARLKPAAWDWRRSIRAALGIGLPFIVGVWLNDVMTGMWVAMGTLMQATGEREGSYGVAVRNMLITAPLGVLGYLIGYLGVLPWAGVVLAMALIAFVAGLVSSYSASLSVGCLQTLLFASIALGIPAIAPFWQPALLYLVGVLLYAVLLGLEAWLFPRRAGDLPLAHLFTALAALASSRAQGQPADAQRRAVTAQLAHGHAFLLQPRHGPAGSATVAVSASALMQRCDAVFTHLLASGDAQALDAAARRLTRLAADLDAAPAVPRRADIESMAGALDDVCRLLGCQTVASGETSTAAAPGSRPAAQVRFSRDTLMSALAMALCMAAAYAAHWFDDNGHWFWIPLTVGLVMKPDFGSIVARSILRSAGTLFGVVIGAAVILLVPKGMGFAIVMMLLAGVIPWAMKRSYAMQAVFLTPLILMLVEIILPGSRTVDYAWLRLGDTVIGSVIVVIFGYLVWPKHHRDEIDSEYRQVLQAISEYLQATLPATQSERQPSADAAARILALRRQAYLRLDALRGRLQRYLVDPPATGAEAAAWLPLVDCAARMCDAVTVYAASLPSEPATAEDVARLHGLAASLQTPVRAEVEAPDPGRQAASPARQLIATLENEQAYLCSLTGDTSAGSPIATSLAANGAV